MCDCLRAYDWLIPVFAYALGDRSLRSLKSWRWVVGMGTAPLASPCKCRDCPFWNTQTNHFIPADPDVTRWGWGRSPSSGLAASDKNPWEEFIAPFNTVIIFLPSEGGGSSCPECRSPSLQEDARGMASLPDNFPGQHQARKRIGKGSTVV